MASTRLPNKVFLPLPDGQTVLDRIINQLQKCRLINQIVITTPDKEIFDFCCKKGVFCNVYYSNRDVLAEFYFAVLVYPADTIVRITADCPLLEPEIVDDVIEKHLQTKADYTCNRNDEDDAEKGDGYDVEVFNHSLLIRTHFSAKSSYDREHVTPWMRRYADKITKLPAPDLEGISLDTLEDYNKICEIIKRRQT